MGQYVVTPQFVRQILGNAHQYRIPRSVAALFIDVFKTVQIQKANGQHAFVAYATAQRLFQAVGQQASVGKTGEWVVVGDAIQLLGMHLVFADVRERAHIVLYDSAGVPYR